MVKDKMTMEMASGEPWQLTGQFIEKNYTVTSGGRDVVRISQKWVTVRDKYTVDVADGADLQARVRHRLGRRPLGGARLTCRQSRRFVGTVYVCGPVNPAPPAGRRAQR